MRILITSSLLCALLFEHEWKGANAFGVAPPTVRSASFRPDSSRHAVEAVVDVIANGGSVIAPVADAVTTAVNPVANIVTTAVAPVADAVTTAVASIAPPDLLKNMDKETVESTAVVGGVFGANGWLLGTLSGSKSNGEAKRLEGVIQEKSKEIESLNSNLAAAEEKQLETQASGEEIIDKMENQIFLMDQEFEESTETLKKDFEKRVKSEIQKRGDKIEQDLKFKYDIKMMREREDMIQEKLVFVSQESSKQEETTLAKLQLAESQSEISSLQNYVNRSENEIQNLRTMIEEGKNPFSAAGVKLQLADLQKDMSGMESVMLEKDQQIEEAKRELEELKTKRSNPLYFVKEIFQSS